MRGIWLTQSILTAGLVACTSSSPRAPGGSVDDPGGAGGRASPPDYNEDNPDASDPNARGDARDDARDSARDAITVEYRSDAGPFDRSCAHDVVALESRRLTAGGATPALFAAAYNSELKELKTPGPVLLLLSGVSLATSRQGTAYLGALRVTGSSVTFDRDYVQTPFTLSAGRTVELGNTLPFALKFTPPAVSALLPVWGVQLTGRLGAGCSTLTVDKLKLMVPSSAGGMAFGGSTIADLMGAPTESTTASGDADAWILELAGQADEIYATVSLDDGGVAP